MELSDFTVDVSKIEQGAWIKNIPECGDLELQVRGFGNKDFRRLQASLIDAVPRAKRSGAKIDPEELDRIAGECMIETILLGWKNLTVAGQPVEYSKERARQYLTDPKFKRFRDAVAFAAAQVAEERAADLEVSAGN